MEQLVDWSTSMIFQHLEAYIDGQGILRVRSKIDGEDEVELDVTADRYFAIVKGNEEQDEFQDVSDIKAVSKTSPTPFRPGNQLFTCLSHVQRVEKWEIQSQF